MRLDINNLVAILRIFCCTLNEKLKTYVDIRHLADTGETVPVDIGQKVL